ncbi:MAG TPA: DUF2142 domain-containing protein, partial [Chloroflexi bacterium]|nr:DUF2142 domain-containing protein [Chloroflexota bacterium]
MPNRKLIRLPIQDGQTDAAAPHPMSERMSQNSKMLYLLLILFAVLGSTYSLFTPIFEAPDEAWHYAYVRYLAEGRGLPSLDDNASGACQQVAQPPLYYTVAALLSHWVSDDDLDTLMWHNPGFGYQAGPTANDNKNMLIHTEREQFPWQGAVLAIRLARLAAIGFGLLTIFATWKLGREAFPDRPAWALYAAALVALVPQFLFISGVVSNDSAAAAMSTASLWAIARSIRHKASLKHSLLTGLLIGLAILSKTSALILLPLALLALWIGHCSSGDAHKRTWGATLTHASVIVLTACLLGGWWYLRNGLLYNDPLALRAHVDTPWGRERAISFLEALTESPKVYRSFWGAFGWGHIQFPGWLYLALGLPIAASLYGWACPLIERAFKNRAPARRRWVFALALGWCLMVFVALLQWMRQVEAPHGRLFFPAIGAFALLVVGGWSNLPRSAQNRWMPIFLGGLAGLSALTPWLFIRPAFATPRLMPPEEAQTSVPAGPVITYGDAARLLGASVKSYGTPLGFHEPRSMSPGDRLSIRACWTALQPISQDYTVFVQVVGQENERVAERRTYPGLGRFPTSRWPVGKAFCDVYTLRLANWTPTPELYTVIIGLYDDEAEHRLPAHTPDGARLGLPIVGRVRVVPALETKISPQAHELAYRLGDHVALKGYHLSGPLQSGQTLT